MGRFISLVLDPVFHLFYFISLRFWRLVYPYADGSEHFISNYPVLFSSYRLYV